jgi:hypothetical protein
MQTISFWLLAFQWQYIYKLTIKKKQAQNRFKSKKSHAITKMNDSKNVNSQWMLVVNELLAKKVESVS